MIIHRSIKHTIRTGQYESVVVEAGVTIDTSELGDKEDAVETSQEILDELIKLDLREATALAEAGSYIKEWGGQ